MSKNKCLALAVFAVAALLLVSCDSGQPAAPVPVPQPVQMPVAPPPPPPPPPQVVVPPATPLLPVAAAEPAQPAAKGGGGKGDGVDKPLPGKGTTGDELVGIYSCKLDADALPTGPFKLPQFGCRIYKSDSGALKLGPSSRGIAALNGDITDPTAAGFFVTGGYKFPGNDLKIKARMQLKAGTPIQYVGKGRGALNDSKDTKIAYTLTMIRK